MPWLEYQSELGRFRRLEALLLVHDFLQVPPDWRVAHWGKHWWVSHLGPPVEFPRDREHHAQLKDSLSEQGPHAMGKSLDQRQLMRHEASHLLRTPAASWLLISHQGRIDHP